MKKIISLAGIITIITTILIIWLVNTPYQSETLTGLAVAAACGLVAAGIIVGALWTAYCFRTGIRWTAPTHAANAHTETEWIRVIREALRISQNGQQPPPPGLYPGQESVWLPPLTDFDVIDVEAEEDNYSN